MQYVYLINKKKKCFIFNLIPGMGVFLILLLTSVYIQLCKSPFTDLNNIHINILYLERYTLLLGHFVFVMLKYTYCFHNGS